MLKEFMLNFKNKKKNILKKYFLFLKLTNNSKCCLKKDGEYCK